MVGPGGWFADKLNEISSERTQSSQTVPPNSGCKVYFRFCLPNICMYECTLRIMCLYGWYVGWLHALCTIRIASNFLHINLSHYESRHFHWLCAVCWVLGAGWIYAQSKRERERVYTMFIAHYWLNQLSLWQCNEYINRCGVSNSYLPLL